MVSFCSDQESRCQRQISWAAPTFLGTFQDGRHQNLLKIELLIYRSLVSLETQI